MKLALHLDTATAPETIKATLDNELAAIPAVSIHTETPKFRAADATMLVAVISASSAALTALLVAIFKLKESKQNQRVVLADKHGNRIEVPREMLKNEAEMQQAMAKLQQMEKPGVSLIEQA